MEVGNHSRPASNISLDYAHNDPSAREAHSPHRESEARDSITIIQAPWRALRKLSAPYAIQ